MMSILFLLFDDRLNGNPRISSVKPKTIWGPTNARAPAVWPEWPPSERACILWIEHRHSLKTQLCM